MPRLGHSTRRFAHRSSSDGLTRRCRCTRNYYAEDHQQHLAKNPYGYRCHANTGVPFPADA